MTDSDAAQQPTAPRVFISYAQESEHLSAWVLALADRLRGHGLDCRLDQYEEYPAKGWRGWMNEQLKAARHVLLVCTAEYRRRFDDNVDDAPPPDVGRGVRWESQHITQVLYDAKFRNDARFVPVLPPDADAQAIPVALKDFPCYRPGTAPGYEALLRLLTAQHSTPMPPLGVMPKLAPKPRGNTLVLSPGAPTTAAVPAAIDNPYPGLEAFKPEQAANFFGRDADSERVTQHLLAQRFTCLVGPSGTGKSSLAAAGVLPRLPERLPGLKHLRFTPQGDPLARLAQAIDLALPEQRSTLGGPRQPRLAAQLASDPAQALAGLRSASDAPLLLLADQFEELFTQTAPAACEAFRAVFDRLLTMPQVHVLLTLRSEFMHRLMDWLGGQRFAAALQPLDAISQPARLRALIAQPAIRAGVAVQPELVDQLVADLAQLKALPLLALTLRRLFDQRDPAAGLTVGAYQRLGGLAAAVAEAARDLDAQIDAAPMLAAAAERLFAHLATVIDEMPTRSTAAVAPLRADADVALLVDGLRSCGFLADPDDDHVELAHEALLKHWPRLAGWCSRCSDHLAQRRQAAQAAQDWVRSGHQAALRWGWERQKPALLALAALAMQAPRPDPELPDDGIAAWRALEGGLGEPLRSFLHPEPLRLLGEVADIATRHQRRDEIGLRLQQIGDPRRGVGLRPDGLPDIAWRPVGPGKVKLETGAKDHFEVPAFEMARYPITWRQYRAFVDGLDGFRNPKWWAGLACDAHHKAKPGRPKWAFGSHPAIKVSWYDAVAFCRWLSERLAEPIRLPTEWEWQWAAMAEGGGQYPWPGDWNPDRANNGQAGIGRTVAVGLYPAGQSRRHLDDMAGNVWEWCVNEHENPNRSAKAGKATRALRGGSWGCGISSLRVAYRFFDLPDFRYDGIGFRVCRAFPNLETPYTAPLNAEPPAR